MPKTKLQLSTNPPQCLLVASYRVFFHPLSKYPGPLAAKLSDVYAGFYAVFMRLHLATDRDLSKFGQFCPLQMAPCP